MGKKVCFIGHRNVLKSDKLTERIRASVEKLIINDNSVYFLFGSRSEFDSICYDIVSELKQAYPHIKLIAYTCRHEFAAINGFNKDNNQIYEKLSDHPVKIRLFDSEYDHPTKYTSGKASYVERNYAMIDDSDFCIFYFNGTGIFTQKSYEGNGISDHYPKSGTQTAYRYAVKKNKTIINLYDKCQASV